MIVLVRIPPRPRRRSGAVCVSPVPDGMDLYGALVLVDAIDDPVGPAPRGVIAVEGFIQWLARAVRVDSERSVDRLHGSGSNNKRAGFRGGGAGLAGGK